MEAELLCLAFGYFLLLTQITSDYSWTRKTRQFKVHMFTKLIIQETNNEFFIYFYNKIFNLTSYLLFHF